MAKPKATDEEWYAELKTSPAYRGIDVDRERAKAEQWLRARAGSRQFTRRFFVNWLNRLETPVSARPAVQPAKPKPKAQVDLPLTAAEWKEQAVQITAELARRQSASAFTGYLQHMLKTATANAERVARGEAALPLRLGRPA